MKTSTQRGIGDIRTSTKIGEIETKHRQKQTEDMKTSTERRDEDKHRETGEMKKKAFRDRRGR